MYDIYLKSKTNYDTLLRVDILKQIILKQHIIMEQCYTSQSKQPPPTQDMTRHQRQVKHLECIQDDHAMPIHGSLVKDYLAIDRVSNTRNYNVAKTRLLKEMPSGFCKQAIRKDQMKTMFPGYAGFVYNGDEKSNKASWWREMFY